MGQYTGKTALVTGASSGIGEAFARHLARMGADLVLVARRESRLQQLASSLSQEHGITATVFPCDLGEPDAPRNLFNAVQQQGLQIDVLINNAGVGKHGDYLERELEEHHQMIFLNVVALNDLTYLFAREMVARGGGEILLVASIAGFLPVSGFATYAATKAYVLSLGESLSAELAGQGVTVTTLCPGGTASEFMSVSGQRIEGWRKQAIMSSDDVARSALKAMARKQPIVVPGLLYKLSVAGLRLVPRRFQARLGQLATESD